MNINEEDSQKNAELENFLNILEIEFNINKKGAIGP